jgi:glyoxylase-like metal-dependent hydrolase (beta-lactamase superfamily II)
MAVGPLQCNCVLLGCEKTAEAVLIDPGDEAPRIVSAVESNGLKVKWLLHTHAHFDHIGATTTLRQKWDTTICLHKADQSLWDNLELQCRTFGVPYRPVPPPDRWLKDGEELSLGNIRGTALHTPGHTPGSMCFHFEADKMIIAGDTLFRGSIGRTDLWGGDFEAIERSIKDRLYALDEATRVITGHGEETTIGFEIRFNPFVRG